ncbi:MAG: DNA (cytosine-5-)-methyltransferase [Fibrobacter sp.]|nr:DNA (cytosine-5-)-methyltransferase [Fibrobacter sp.]
MTNKKFTCIDLLAGIGGFHIAMHEAGGKCVFASEIDKFARQTYEHNFKKISPKVFTNGNFNEDITKQDYSKIPDFDVLCAGFPCQPFSNAGLRKGFDDTRGTLFFNIKEIIRKKIEDNKAPKIILLENVKGFKNHDKGKTYKTVEKTLNHLGYVVTSEVLNTKNFGIPQNRERIFIVAWNHDLIKADKFDFPVGIDEKGNYLYNKKDLEKTRKTEVQQILLSNCEIKDLEKKANRKYTISEKLWAGHQRRKKEHRKKGNGFGYSLFDNNSSYTSTISARYYKDGSEILIDQTKTNRRPRKLHPIEAARLQGFPIDTWYSFPVSDTQAYKQLGNSVTVPVVSALAKEIKEQLLKG